MKTNRKVFLLAFLAIVLVLTSTSCSDPGRETKAEVRVIGTAVGENNNSRAVSTMKFGSGKVIVGDKDVTASLVPVGQPSDGQNNVEFTTTVPVVGNTVKYTVSAKRGFVFDEWEFDRRTVMNDFKDIYKEKWVDVLREILRAIAGDRQTIEINPDYIRFIRPTFDRGVHFDPNYIGEGDGSSEKPFNDINDVLGYIKNESRFDDDELTIKFRSGNIGSFDLSKIETGYWNDELEIELKLLGGYDSDWNLSGARTSFGSLVFPDMKNIDEIEVELRNIHIETFNKTDFFNDDLEIEFRNCSVGSLNASGIVNGLIIETVESSSSSLIFVNSVAPYVENAEYYHSVVKNADGRKVNGANNIIQNGDSTNDNGKNHYVVSWNGNEYKTSDPDLIEKLIHATPLNEDTAGLDDDILEEDIVGRERFLYEDDDRWHKGIKVSYGPYEYQWFDD